jgi:hypothetical protein
VFGGGLGTRTPLRTQLLRKISVHYFAQCTWRWTTTNTSEGHVARVPPGPPTPHGSSTAAVVLLTSPPEPDETKPKMSGAVPIKRHKPTPNDFGSVYKFVDHDPKLLNSEIAQPRCVSFVLAHFAQRRGKNANTRIRASNCLFGKRSDPTCCVGDLWMWLQLMRLHFEAFRGAVVVVRG